MGSSRYLNAKYERLWAEKFIEFQYGTLVMSRIREFQVTELGTMIMFDVIKAHSLV